MTDGQSRGSRIEVQKDCPGDLSVVQQIGCECPYSVDDESREAAISSSTLTINSDRRRVSSAQSAAAAFRSAWQCGHRDSSGQTNELQARQIDKRGGSPPRWSWAFLAGGRSRLESLVGRA
jgi:hypothetical protein